MHSQTLIQPLLPVNLQVLTNAHTDFVAGAPTGDKIPGLARGATAKSEDAGVRITCDMGRASVTCSTFEGFCDIGIGRILVVATLIGT